MRSLFLLVISVVISNAIAIRCKCSKELCDDRLDSCYTRHRYCFTETSGPVASYGCLDNTDFVASIYCSIKFIKCCNTDFCNGNNSTRTQSNQLPAIADPGHVGPPVRCINCVEVYNYHSKLCKHRFRFLPKVRLDKQLRRSVTVLITDSDDVRNEIDGYVAILYTINKSGQRTKYLKPNARFFSFDDLYLNATSVVEVSSYKKGIASRTSSPITVKIKVPVCAYYNKMGDLQSEKRFKQCPEFSCFGWWEKVGTTLKLRERGCWNKEPKPRCKSFAPKDLFCFCNTEKCSLPKNSQINL